MKAKAKEQKPEMDEQEIVQRRDAVIKRMLETPPQKHKDVPKKRKPKDDGTRV